MYQRCMGDIHSKGVCKKVDRQDEDGASRGVLPARGWYQPDPTKSSESELSLQGKFYLGVKGQPLGLFHSKHLETVR